MSLLINNLICMERKQAQHIGPLAFRKSLCWRTKEIRKALGYKRKQMADLMGVTLDAWEKYESRTPLPHHLIPRLIELSGFDTWYYISGKAPVTIPKVKRG